MTLEMSPCKVKQTRWFILLIVLVLSSCIYSEEETLPLSQAQELEQAMYAPNTQALVQVVSKWRDAGTPGSSIDKIIKGHPGLAAQLESFKTERVEILSAKRVGSSIVLVKILRVFNSAFFLSSFVFVKRDNGWRVCSIGANVSSEAEDIFTEIRDSDYQKP